MYPKAVDLSNEIFAEEGSASGKGRPLLPSHLKRQQFQCRVLPATLAYAKSVQGSDETLGEFVDRALAHLKSLGWK